MRIYEILGNGWNGFATDYGVQWLYEAPNDNDEVTPLPVERDAIEFEPFSALSQEDIDRIMVGISPEELEADEA